MYPKRKIRGTTEGEFCYKDGQGLTAAGGSLAAGAAFLTDDVKHGYIAVERSGRVVGTLAVNINEYVCML